MIEPLEQLRSTLQDHGQSLTRPRKKVFTTLQAKGPLTMAELIQASGTSLDRASVYRTIKLYEQLGIVQRLQIGWKYRVELSNSFQHHHHHMYCTQCGNVIAMPEDTVLEERLQALAANISFSAQDHQIEIRGICANCSRT